MPQDRCVQDGRNWRLLCCDLHDGAAQYVSAALLRLRTMEAQHEMPAEARPHLWMAEALLDVALRDIREIIAGRSPEIPLEASSVRVSARNAWHNSATADG
jgi:signal transduction histidine kinase